MSEVDQSQGLVFDAINMLPEHDLDRQWLSFVAENVERTPPSVLLMAVQTARKVLGLDEPLALGSANFSFPAATVPIGAAVEPDVQVDVPDGIADEAEGPVVTEPNLVESEQVALGDQDSQQFVEPVAEAYIPTPFGAVPDEVNDAVYATEENHRLTLSLDSSNEAAEDAMAEEFGADAEAVGEFASMNLDFDEPEPEPEPEPELVADPEPEPIDFGAIASPLPQLPDMPPLLNVEDVAVAN